VWLSWFSQVSQWHRWLLRHWLLLACIVLGGYVLLPFLAPVFMALGWTAPAQAVYGFFSTQCHLMAQRSFFLFGNQLTYGLDQLPVALTGQFSHDMLVLRDFIGNEDLGWKVAQCTRSVFLFGTVWVSAIAFRLLRQRHRIRFVPLGLAIALMLPMVLDGTTHLMSELTGGLAAGFRYDNAWLARLTAYRLPDSFYQGDAWGSFNFWARLISAVLFGLAVAWLAFPSLDRTFRRAVSQRR